MEKNNFDKLNDLIMNRRELVAVLKKNNDKSHELLAEGLYKRKAHFITELLQNAEDEGASTVSFILNDNELIFTHDSSNYFDFDDIQSISNFGDNKKKKDKDNAIGRFGIGFKSVYSITDAPRIISGVFDVTITEMCVPENNNPKDIFQGTKIILPFRQIESRITIELLENEFKKLDTHYLLFLSKIKSINWKTPNSSGRYERNIVENNGFVELKDNEKIVNYLVFNKNILIEDKSLIIKIAFELDSSRSAIVRCNKSPLFAFFPTDIETNLNFLIHAPFHTTESRENLDETDDRNGLLQGELGILFAEKLIDIKRLNLMNVDFFNMMPIENDVCSRNNIYSIFYNSLLNELKKKENEFLPTTDKNIFAAFDNVMLLGSSELSELLTNSQAKAIWGRANWIASEITATRTETTKLYQYLYYNLSIPNNDLRSFSTRLNEEFLLNQSNDWLVKFYKTIYEKTTDLWEKDSKNPILRKKPIIRIEHNGKIEQVLPFKDDGKPAVYLPLAEKINYPTVLSSIVENNEVVEFLRAFGLDYPDIFSEINEIILPRLKNGKIYEGFFDDIITILSIQNEKTEKKTRLLDDLKKISFILGENYITKTEKIVKCDEIYFPTSELLMYFENNKNVYFVKNIEVFNDIQKQKYNSLLNELVVEDICPRRISFYPEYSQDEKKALIPWYDVNVRAHSQKWRDYKLDGLDVFCNSTNLTKEKSVFLWNSLSKQDINFFNGQAEWFFRYPYNGSFDAVFVRELRKSSWLYINNKIVAPTEISFEDLPEEYKKDISASKKLADILHFRLDEDREYERKHKGKKVVDVEEWEELQKLKVKKEDDESEKKKKDRKESEFKPNIEVSDAPLNISTYKGKDTQRKYEGEGVSNNDNEPCNNDNTNVNNNNQDNNLNTNELNKEENNMEINNSEYIKGIGKYGEELVSRVLHEEFSNNSKIEIIDLNSNGKIGVGADFEIRQNGIIIRLVEVKSTTNPKGSPLIVSGTQWETARDFYNLNNGDIYWIYCVYNAGTEKVQVEKVQNPIKQWKEGKILADPINFILEPL